MHNEIRARLARATPGPWEAQTDDDGQLIIKMPDDPQTSVIVWCGDLEGCTGKDCHNHELIAHAPADISELLRHIDWLNMEHAASIGRERSDERSQTILDMRKYLAEGLRAMGISADDKISLTEVLELFEWQQAKIVRLTDELKKITGEG